MVFLITRHVYERSTRRNVPKGLALDIIKPPMNYSYIKNIPLPIISSFKGNAQTVSAQKSSVLTNGVSHYLYHLGILGFHVMIVETKLQLGLAKYWVGPADLSGKMCRRAD